MLDLLTLSIMLLFLIHFYLFKYKQYNLWFKLNKSEANISEYNHVYTPGSNSVLEKNIDVAHKMKANHIIEIINYNEDETILDVFDENKNLVYHFFCPKYLLFSSQFNNTHHLQLNKRYSFFLSSVGENRLITFRQVSYDKVNNIPYLCKPSEITYYQEEDTIEDDFEEMLEECEYMKANIYDNWPQSGLLMEAKLTIPEDERLLFITTVKPGLQSIEIISAEESYYLPISQGNKYYTHYLESDNNKNIIIRERISAISKNSIIAPFCIIYL